MTTEKLTLIIAGRKYPVTVEKSEVEDVRAIEKDLNNKINEYIQLYKTNDKLDIITLLLLTNTLELQKHKKTKRTDNDVISLLSDIQESIDKVL